MDRPRPWLRYVDASDLDNSTIKFDGMPVDSPTGEKLGEVDGLIVDVSSGRPYYVVVDARGWFKSKFFLLPIGHVGISSAQDRLVADIGKDRVERYPGFDRGEFEKLTDDEVDRMAGQIADVCCPPLAATTTTIGAVWMMRSHYTAPMWWRAEYYSVATPSASSTRAAASAAMPSDSRGSEQPEIEREQIVAHGGDVSPHLGGRARPGDVLGLETGGEETHIGDTSEDENGRRREADKEAATKARE
jgi:hypothetical protein